MAILTNAVGPILIQFPHGIGDAAQLIGVLKNLKYHSPDLVIDVASFRGKHSLFHGLARRSLILDEDEIEGTYSQVLRLDWRECHETYEDSPATKSALCLRDVFGLVPLPLPYAVQIDPENAARVDDFIKTLPHGEDFVLIHYQGNSLPDWKNLEHETIARFCHFLLHNELTPVILDWVKTSPLPDGERIIGPDVNHPLWKGYGTGDGNTLAALISRAKLMVGIDSGPMHVAQATNTPTIAVWTKHHPIHYADLSGDVLHLLPEGHCEFVRGRKEIGMTFFRENYNHRVYEELEADLMREAEKILGRSRRSSRTSWRSSEGC